MIRALHRVRGANTVGARGPGEVGPYGRWPDDLEAAEPDEDDDGLDDGDGQDHDDT